MVVVLATGPLTAQMPQVPRNSPGQASAKLSEPPTGEVVSE